MSALDIDLGLVQAICREGMPAFLDQGLPSDFLEGTALVAFNYVESYYSEYGKVPDIETIRKETGIDLHQAPIEPVKFWCDQIKERSLYTRMLEGLQKISTQLEKRQATEAFHDLEELVFNLRSNNHYAVNRPVPFFSNPQEMIDELESAKAGLTGVPSPFPTMNRITKGWQKGDLGLIAARPGLGKTFVLLMLALWAWKEKKKVLIASTEMSHKSLKRRAISLNEKISYSKIRDGQLNIEEENRYSEALHRLSTDENMLIMGDGFDMNLSILEAGIIETKPDLVLVDGMYLFKNKGSFKSKHENLGSVFDGFKAIAKRNMVPIVGTTQMNRPPKQGAVVQDLSRLAFTDNAGMVADWVFYLKQTKEMKDNKELEILPIKVRESDWTKNIKLNWDFAEHDYSEKDIDMSKVEEQVKSMLGAEGNYIESIPEEEQPF